jgi:hypothetical protein
MKDRDFPEITNCCPHDLAIRPLWAELHDSTDTANPTQDGQRQSSCRFRGIRTEILPERIALGGVQRQRIQPGDPLDGVEIGAVDIDKPLTPPLDFDVLMLCQHSTRALR